MLKTLKNFGALCAVESVTAFTFLVTTVLCIREGELIAALVAFGVAAGAVVLGVVRFKIIKENEARRNEVADESKAAAAVLFAPRPPRNRAKPAPVKSRKVVKKGKARPKK